MAIDLRSIDKRKALFLTAAVVAGLIAAVLVNTYVEKTVKEQALVGAASGRQAVETLRQRIDTLEQESRVIVDQQRKLAMSQQRQQSAPGRQQASAQPPLSKKTPPGYRAITATVDKLYAVGGMVTPGDYVDIIVHLDVPMGQGTPDKKTTVTLFQNTLILAVGESLHEGVKKDIRDGDTVPVTFALNPQEAELLT